MSQITDGAGVTTNEESSDARRTAEFWKSEHLAGNAEIARLRQLAEDAYRAWDSDQDGRVGKLLRAMLDEDFCHSYRPDLTPKDGLRPAA